MNEEQPRAYTVEEARDMILQHIRDTARYWAKLPDFDPATGRTHTIEDRCHGVAFSILSVLDGCTMLIPAVTLKMDPHEDDKEFLRAEGENWFEPGTEISDMLHEHYGQILRKLEK